MILNHLFSLLDSCRSSW